MRDIGHPVWMHFTPGLTPQVFIPYILMTGLESNSQDVTRATTICKVTDEEEEYVRLGWSLHL